MMNPVRRPIRSALMPALRSPFDGGSGSWYQRLINAAESAAVSSGISMWYAPPNSVSNRLIDGPFVNPDRSGGVPTVGGVVGFVKDRKVI